MNDTKLQLNYGVGLEGQPPCFQNLVQYVRMGLSIEPCRFSIWFPAMYRKDQINAVLKEYGGYYENSEITFNTPEQKTWFILKWS